MPITGLIADPASTRGLSPVHVPITGLIAEWPVTWPVSCGLSNTPAIPESQLGS